MNEYSLSNTYTNSKELVKNNDFVLIDDRKGIIEEICMPCSQLADDYHCTKSGGLLILFNDGILELLPFGKDYEIVKQG